MVRKKIYMYKIKWDFYPPFQAWITLFYEQTFVEKNVN